MNRHAHCLRKLVLSVSSFVIVLTSGAVLAEEPKHERANIGVEEHARPKKGEKGDKKANAKPGLSKAEIYGVELQKKLIKGIDTTIKYLSKTAKKFPKKSSARYDVLVKLLNLYLENAIYVSSEEHQKYNEDWEKWDAGGRKGQEPVLSTAKSQQLWQNVEIQADEIMAEYPTAKQADVILFNKALAEQFLAKEKEAARTFSIIIQKYPNSPVTGDAYFALGDYYFDKNDFRNSKSNYKSALRYRRSKRYGWALFKLGWSHFNLGEFKETLVYWKQTVAYSKTVSQDQGARLKEEALRDLVNVFAELKMVEPAIAYYRANGGQKYIPGFMQLLASTFVDQGQYNQAIAVYKKYQGLFPMDESAPETQKEVVALYSEIGNHNALWQELSRLSTAYGPKSGWANHNNKNRKLVLEAQTMIKDQLIYYPKVLHNKSIKSSNDAGLQQALRGYELFLKTYPTAKEAPEIKYLMADILYFRKDYRRSGQLYLEIALLGQENAVIYGEKTNAKTNIHQKSARYMLDSLLLDFEPQFKLLVKEKPDFSKPPKALDPKAKNFIRGCGYYVKWYPNDKANIKTCDIYVSEIYYRSNDKKQALNYLWVVAKKYPSSPEGKLAAENIIPMYKDDKKGLLKAVEELLAIKEYDTGDLGKKLRSLRWATENEAIAKEHNTLKRARLYESQAKKNPTAPEADTLWYNAAIDFLKAGEVGAGLGAYRTIVEKYPKSAQHESSFLQVALLYEKLYNLKEASVYFLKFARQFPKSDKAQGAYAKSCDILIALGSAEAMPVCLEYIGKHPKLGTQVLYSLIQLHKRKKKLPTVKDLVYNTYVPKFNLAPNDKIVAYYYIYDLAGSKGPDAEQAAGKILAEYRGNPKGVTGEALRYVGEIVYKSIGDLLEPFKRVKLKGGTVEAMLASLQSMAASLDDLKARYGKVLEIGDPYYGVAALAQIGAGYEYFAESLENPPAIQGATTADVKAKLAPQAQAAKKEATGYYTNAQNTIEKFSVYNEWSIRVINLVARSKGEESTFDEIVMRPDFVEADIPGALVGEIKR